MQQIRGGDAGSIEELYSALSQTVRPTLAHVIDRESIDDAIHEVLVIVLEAIVAGQLRDPRRLMAFAHRVARFQGVAYIRSAIFRRKHFTESSAEPEAPPEESPDSVLDRYEKSERIREVLRRLSLRDREILERFYLYEQPREKICGEMNLSATQFRLLKSRAIARCSSIAGNQPTRPF